MDLIRRSRSLVITLVMAVGGEMATIGAAGPDAKPSFDRLYRAYAAGDHGILRRAVQTGRDVQALNPPRDAASLRKWLGSWDRTRATFLLEFADAEIDMSPHLVTTVAAGRSYVMTRPRPLGRDRNEDAFETAWHKAAMGLLEARMFTTDQDAYLDLLEKRYAAPTAPPVDPRFVLERAIAQEQRCVLPDAPARDECLRDAIRRYAAAGIMPANADEASVRAAWALFQLRRYDDALQMIDRACPANDPDLTYWMHLFRGRILEALDRMADAEPEYRSALDARPFAQSAGVALAMTLFKLHRPDEAVAAARAARQQPDDLVDPWWIYLHGDARLVPEWRAELRSRITP
ncbi:MAG TPA: hypothetical protein VLT86_01805 [Vicinamibacterales bacterium]|nr:hypothetical protein [Vicinamibacterales bacterium]